MNYFNLFSNIFITKGAKRILISDLQRNRSELFPLELYDIIEELKENSVENVVKQYDVESQDFIREYINMLLENEFGFITKESWDYNFPPLSYEFLTPNEIINAYLEIEDLNCLLKIEKSLSNLGTEHVVIHYNKPLLIEDFNFIENIFKNSPITSIEIFSEYGDYIDEIFVTKLESVCNRIHNLVFYNCEKKPFKIKDIYKFTLFFVKQNIGISSCGKVDIKYFNTNLPKVLEAYNYNSCLHKKISIDKDGNIKNCPSMSQCFGNIKETSLEEALNHRDFKKYWNLSKDKIEVCKDCEFRYICTDCRAYTDRTHYNEVDLDISKPLKCGYNPYSAKWEEWSVNPLKQKAINYYGLI
ncbi:grasp-with-spasm system SPASM domain peptide maturase [Chryseobacterium sp. S-02]|uniref:grasp-with-spasm system SPASM domain peptide maturase n=1 Tax=Chryseobacterium sp. S-02 TaxID=3404064 RepID=UPI003CF5149B